MVDQTGASGLYSRNKGWLPGGAPRLAALLIAHLCPISSLFAPCDPGAALRHPLLVQRLQATSLQALTKARDSVGSGSRSLDLAASPESGTRAPARAPRPARGDR